VADSERIVVEGQLRLTSGARVAETMPDGSAAAGASRKDQKSTPDAKVAQ
jgi:hypothetical protein